MSDRVYYVPDLNTLAENIGEWRRGKGFYSAGDIGGSIPDEHLPHVGMADLMLSKIALMHSELGEATEAVRHGDWENFKEELADVVIRVLDTCDACGIDIARAIAEKMTKNESRPYRHGKAT